MKVRDAMTPRPICCTPDASLETIARMMKDCDCGVIPVVEDLSSHVPIGVITDRDIVIRAVATGVSPALLSARDCMTTPPVTVTEDMSLRECIDVLEERHIRRLLVVDDAGVCVGIIAPADVARNTSMRKSGELLQEVSRPDPGMDTPVFARGVS
jgi:CBS domain-containing protein